VLFTRQKASAQDGKFSWNFNYKILQVPTYYVRQVKLGVNKQDATICSAQTLIFNASVSYLQEFTSHNTAASLRVTLQLTFRNHLYKFP
jgi:hypothetical protein